MDQDLASGSSDGGSAWCPPSRRYGPDEVARATGLARYSPLIGPRGRPPGESPVTTSSSLDLSYRFCAKVARREARNFYFAFQLLPTAGRRSMCALYAFMRHTDDL